jgi:hypothetical protein
MEMRLHQRAKLWRMHMDRIEKARQFFEHHGRDIDRIRFDYHFGSASQEALLETLGRYQNPDGGFGHGLEVDIKAPDSNPFATELALLICIQADVPVSHPLLTRTVEYLEQSQFEDGSWRFSEGIYQHELAPWFQGWEFPNLNPACTLAGLLTGLGLGSERLHERVARLFQRLARPEDLLGDEYYGVRPYAYYFLPEHERPQRELYISGVLWWLMRQHAEHKLADASHFFDYVRGPRTYTGRNLPAQVVSEQLDRLGAEQAEDGGWPTPYDEGWRGPFTVQSLLVLKEFNRL